MRKGVHLDRFGKQVRDGGHIRRWVKGWRTRKELNPLPVGSKLTALSTELRVRGTAGRF